MGRVSCKSPRYRTKERMVEDVVFVLNVPESTLSYGAKFAVLKNACWAWTEFDGKYEGCRYWSKKAADDPTAQCIHEHAVPRSVVIEMLCALDDATSTKVREILERFLFGVVVTLGQDKQLNSTYRSTMPPDFSNPGHSDFHDPWLRYRKSNIEVVERGSS